MTRGCKPGRDPGHQFQCDRNALNRRRPCRSSSNALDNNSGHVERCAVREIQLKDAKASDDALEGRPSIITRTEAGGDHRQFRGMPALGARSCVRPAADVGAIRAGRFAGMQSPADPPHRAVILTRVCCRHQRHCGRGARGGFTAADRAAPMTSASSAVTVGRSGTELPRRARIGLGTRPPASPRRSKPSCISTPIAFSRTMSRRLSLPEPCRISRASRLDSGVRRHRAGRDGSLPPVANCETQHAAFGTAARADPFDRLPSRCVRYVERKEVP